MAKRETKAKSGEGGLKDEMRRYFDSISKPETVREKYDTGEQTAKGEPVFGMRDVTGADGEPIRVRRWYSPPSEAGLCLFLGLSRARLAEELSLPGNAGAREYSALMFEVYAEQLLHDGRQTQGLLERLRASEVCAGSPAASVGMSLEERERTIREAYASVVGAT